MKLATDEVAAIESMVSHRRSVAVAESMLVKFPEQFAEFANTDDAAARFVLAFFGTPIDLAARLLPRRIGKWSAKVYLTD